MKLNPIIIEPAGAQHTLKGTLVKCTYEGLPFEFPEWDDLFVVGTIPVGIWDTIRAKHKEAMRDPDWSYEDLIDITINTLTEAGCTVYNFACSETFPAIIDDHTCAFCHDIIPKGDNLITSDSTGDAVFCSTSCLFEAMTQRNDAIRIVSIDPATFTFLIECQACFHQEVSNSGGWVYDGVYLVPGKDGFLFTILVCPECGERSAMVIPMVPGSDLDLAKKSLELVIEYEKALRKGQLPQLAREVPRPGPAKNEDLTTDVVSKFNVSGWTCSWEYPGYFHVQQNNGKYFFSGNAYEVEDGKPINQIRIDLHDDEGRNLQAWSIPFEGEITAEKVINAFIDCITIFDTEEIPGVVH